MTDGQSEWMRLADENRPIPDERDQIDAPHRPDLRCREHDSLCAVAHSLHNRIVHLEGELAHSRSRIVELEQRVEMLEEKDGR